MASSSRILAEDILLNGRYRISRVLGRGGMGTVYLARHEELDSVLAIKEVSAPNIEDESYRMALDACRKESKLLFRLDHPNLPKVTDAFVEEGRFYLVMEFIDGVTLETKLREAQGRPLDARQVAEWGLQITDVLSYLHHLDPPLIFRDIKPANIMVQPDGRIRLIDFGIARVFEEGKTKDTALLGSVGYSPPEQFGQHQTDARSDIYALGATLHHLLTGRDPAAQPFKFPPASALNPLVPDNLSRLVDRCLALESDKRPADVRDVAMDLLAIRDQLAAMPSPSHHHPAARPGTAVAPNAVTLPSGATTGSSPRVISSKLKDNEPKRSLATVLAVAIAALIVIGGTALFVFKKPHSTKTNTPKPPQGIVNNPVIKPTEPLIPSVTVPPVTPSTTDAPPPAANDTVKIESVNALGVSPDAQGANWLQVQLKGTIKSHNSKSGMAALFFYDENDQPIFITPNTPYSNDKGHLSVAHSLVIDSDLYLLDQTLTIPVEQFPKDKRATALKYRCIVYVDGVRIAETKITPLEIASPTGTPTTDGGTASGNSSNGTSGNP